jgi:hypothetical protein
MTQLKTPSIRRAGGSLDVYTGLMLAALLVLAAGTFLLARKNMEHSAAGREDGSVFKLVQQPR